MSFFQSELGTPIASVIARANRSAQFWIEGILDRRQDDDQLKGIHLSVSVRAGRRRSLDKGERSDQEASELRRSIAACDAEPNSSSSFCRKARRLRFCAFAAPIDR